MDTAGTYSQRLNSVIPGGAHTYSRGDDQFPSNAPEILESGKGAYVFDPSGKKYLDYGMALRAVTLGYAQDEVDEAAFVEIRKGNNLTRASLTELKAAELLTAIIPSAQMVKFAKNGSNVVTAAVKLARGFTGRNYVIRCSDHPFFSFDDWFIGNTVMSKGTIAEHREYTLQFPYNNIEALRALLDQFRGEVACVIIEPATSVSPCDHADPGKYSETGCATCKNTRDHFLHKVKQLCQENGAVFILDEMITGFRWDLKGAQAYFDIEPDLCTFGKGMANGFSVAALAGKKEIMNQGSIKEDGTERLFLVSTTHGAEMCGLGAFIKTVEIYKRDNVTSHLWKHGKELIDGMNGVAQELGISEYFSLSGYHCAPVYTTRNRQGEPDFAFRTLFSQEMIRNGVLMPWIALSYAHQQEELEICMSAAKKALEVYRQALDGNIADFLSGPSIRPVFRKYN